MRTDSQSVPIVFYGLGLAATVVVRGAALRRVRHSGPRVVGILRPRIVIPDDLTPEARAMALAHEKAHVRRRDPFWSFVAELVCIGLWFAPPVWLCARAMRAEAEAACDAEALACTGASQRAYARLLLDFAGPAPANALGGPARRLARRILMLQRQPKPLSRPFVGGLFVLGLVTLLPWRAVAQGPLPGTGRPAPLQNAPWLPAVGISLEDAARTILKEPGIKAKIGWTGRQEAELQRGSARWKKVWDAFAAELYTRQKTMTLRDWEAWDAAERPKAFARAQAAARYPWTPEQRRMLQSIALVRFGSALWKAPEVARRLDLAKTQIERLTLEDQTIQNAYASRKRTLPVLQPARPMPDRVKREIADLENRYLNAKPADRGPLNARLWTLRSRYRPVYVGSKITPSKLQSDTERIVAKTWSMRSAADRRLRTTLSESQRRTLSMLKTNADAWSQPDDFVKVTPSPGFRLKSPAFTADQVVRTGVKTTLFGNARLDDEPLDALPDPADPNEPIKIVANPDGTEWRIFRRPGGIKGVSIYELRRTRNGQPVLFRRPNADVGGTTDPQIRRVLESVRRSLPASTPQSKGRLVRTVPHPDGTKTNLYTDKKPGQKTGSYHVAVEHTYKAEDRRPAEAQPWTLESIRRSLHLADGEEFDFKPDPKNPAIEVAEMPDREGIVTKHRIYRRKQEDGSYAYQVESILRMRASTSKG